LIETLRIAGLAIVERAELEFGPGLNVLTGETGAGKSIVLGALALLAGARAASDSVRDGCEEAVVEAVFRTDLLPDLEAELERRGIQRAGEAGAQRGEAERSVCLRAPRRQAAGQAGGSHELVVRRSVARNGRSRAWISGQLVPVSTLAELFEGRIEISSQHDSHALRRPEVHSLLLDARGGLLAERRAVAEGVARLRELERELGRLRAEARELARRQDTLAFQIREIDAARLAPGEPERLRAERSRLAHADRLRAEGAAAVSAVAGDPAQAEARGAADLLAEASRRVAGLVRIDPALAELAARLEGLAADARDAALDLGRRIESADADPARLAALEDRLAELERLRRKYGATPEEILRFRDEAGAELGRLEGAGARETELEKEREGLVARLERDAEALSRGRARAARSLASAVEAGLRELAMPEARFEVALEPAPAPEGLPCGAGGREVVEFRLAANPGEPPRPLRRVASGGELSRSFLALRGALREAEAGMVLVFDEVDAGIGGPAADAVGRALDELASRHQVLCITHLPQIAAFAHTHLRVEKLRSGGRAVARIAAIAGEARIEEIARMAGGETVAEATRRHARHLVGRRRPPRGARPIS
jgi:DNA repair protein RecN (Recombination protein N)